MHIATHNKQPYGTHTVGWCVAPTSTCGVSSFCPFWERKMNGFSPPQPGRDLQNYSHRQRNTGTPTHVHKVISDIHHYHAHIPNCTACIYMYKWKRGYYTHKHIEMMEQTLLRTNLSILYMQTDLYTETQHALMQAGISNVLGHQNNRGI